MSFSGVDGNHSAPITLYDQSPSQISCPIEYVANSSAFTGTAGAGSTLGLLDEGRSSTSPTTAATARIVKHPAHPCLRSILFPILQSQHHHCAGAMVPRLVMTYGQRARFKPKYPPLAPLNSTRAAHSGSGIPFVLANGLMIYWRTFGR